MPVQLEILLAGRFHIGRIELEWKFGGAETYSVQFSYWTGEAAAWLSVSGRSDKPSCALQVIRRSCLRDMVKLLGAVDGSAEGEMRRRAVRVADSHLQAVSATPR